MLTVNTIFRLIVLAKRQGKGKLGNGVILTRLLGTLSDLGTDGAEIQRRLVISPDHVTVNRYADKLMQNRVRFPHPDEPYGIPLTGFRSLLQAEHPDTSAYLRHLERMYRFCRQVLDPEQIIPLTHCLLEQLRQDPSVQSLFYNGQFHPKNCVFRDTRTPQSHLFGGTSDRAVVSCADGIKH